MNVSLAELVVGAAAVWRVTHLLHAEDGPWELLAKLRRLAADGVWGRMMDCFYCLSAWVAVPFAVAIGTNWGVRLMLWPAFSGMAILLERATQRAPVAQWKFEDGVGQESEDV